MPSRGYASSEFRFHVFLDQHLPLVFWNSVISGFCLDGCVFSAKQDAKFSLCLVLEVVSSSVGIGSVVVLTEFVAFSFSC